MVESLNRWEKTISVYRIASGVDVSGGTLAATVLEHSLDNFQNILKQAPFQCAGILQCYAWLFA